MQTATTGPQGFIGDTTHEKYQTGGNGLTIPTGPQGVMQPLPDLPREYDILLLDLNSKNLKNEVAKAFNMEYLGIVSKNMIQKQVSGVLWGEYDRIMVPLVVERKGIFKIVFFLLDTGAPYTYMCEEVFLVHVLG